MADNKVLNADYDSETSSDLVDASSAKSTAEASTEDSIVAQAARLINYNSSCGQRSALWQHLMPDFLKEKLESDGYTLSQLEGCADPNRLTLISW